MLGILSGVTYAGRHLVLAIDAWSGFCVAHYLESRWQRVAVAAMVLQNTQHVPMGSYFALAMFGFFQMSLAYILFLPAPKNNWRGGSLAAFAD